MTYFPFKVDLPLNQKGVMQAVKGAMLLVFPCRPLPTQASFTVERHFTVLKKGMTELSVTLNG